MSTSQVSFHGSVLIEPSASDAEGALLALLSCLDDKTKDACMSPEFAGTHLSVEESHQFAEILESALLVFTATVRNRVLALRTRRNNLMSFDSLPTELVAEILVASVPLGLWGGNSEAEIFGISRLQQLASVCKRWRDVVKTCPQLWTMVGLSRPGVAALKLKKSGTLPLTIEMLVPQSIAELKDFLSITTEHYHRCSTAYISYYHTSVEEVDLEAIEIINRVLGLPMPILQFLELSHYTWNANTSFDLSRLINAPLLRHLYLSYISPLSLPTSIYSTLHTLCIGDVRNATNFANMLINALGMCAELRKLGIFSISCDSMDDIQVPTRGRAVHLPNLEELECSSNDERAFLPILDTIRAQKLSWLHIWDDTEDGTAVFREILHSHGSPSLLSTVFANSGCTSVMVVVGRELEIRTKPIHRGGVHIHFTAALQWQENIIHIFKEKHLPLNTPPIDLHIYDSHNYDGSKEAPLVVDILKITQIITQTPTLSLHCGLPNVRTFFKALVEANEADFARQLPNVTNVVLPRVYDEDGWEELVAMLRTLEARYVGCDMSSAEGLPFKIRDEAGRRLNLGTGEWARDGDDKCDAWTTEGDS